MAPSHDLETSYSWALSEYDSEGHKLQSQIARKDLIFILGSLIPLCALMVLNLIGANDFSVDAVDEWSSACLMNAASPVNGEEPEEPTFSVEESLGNWWLGAESNHRHNDFQSSASGGLGSFPARLNKLGFKFGDAPLDCRPNNIQVYSEVAV